MQSKRQTGIKKDTMQCHSLPAGENTSVRNKLQNGRKQFSSKSTPVPFIVFNNSACEQNELDHSQQTKDWCLDTEPAIQEQCDVTDHSDVHIIITHVEVVNNLQN